MKTKEEIKLQKKEYYQQNKEKILSKSKAYYEENKEKAIAYQKEYQKRYRAENKDKIKAYRDLYKKKATNKQVVNALNLKLDELEENDDLLEDEVFKYLCNAIKVSRDLFASELDADLLNDYIETLIRETQTSSYDEE